MDSCGRRFTLLLLSPRLDGERVVKKFKVKRPSVPIYYVATKDGDICHQTESKMDVIAWKKAFGASVWKATTKFRKVHVPE